MALTGFLVNIGGGSGAVCADSAQNAIESIGARFPFVAGSQPVLCNLESSVYTAPNLFTNTITCHDLTSAQSWTLSHLLHLAVCDPALPIGGGALVEPVTAANIGYVFSWGMGAVVFFFFLGMCIWAAVSAIKKV